MKKKILFIMNALTIGGAEKSLLTILSMLDYSKYDVDLFLFGHQGEWMEYLPKEVHLFGKDEFRKNTKGDFEIYYHDIVRFIKRVYHKLIGKLYFGWDQNQYKFLEINRNYDVSIAFMERTTIYFNVDKVIANKKIGFIHSDYSKYPYDYKMDKEYFENYHKIAAVSEHSKNALTEIFPEYEDKFIVIKNMVSKDLIEKMAAEEFEFEKKEKTTIVTVGRLVKEKGINKAIEVCKMLVDDGYDIKWYMIGQGAEEKNLKKMIEKYQLQDKFVLVGAQKNPYKWIKNCDIYVQPSISEGFGITICEAKVLQKPIVANEIEVFKEQIEDGVNGYLAKNDEMMYNRIIELIENKDKIREKFIQNLKKEDNLENRQELEKLYGVLDE